MSEYLSRKQFMSACAGCALASTFPGAALGQAREKPPRVLRKVPKEGLKLATYWESVPEKNMVRCTLCPNKCERKEYEVTACNTRINIGNKLYTMVYSRPCVLSQDPLTKNPLFNVAPGSVGIGAATAGCNLKCKYCQNWDISQVGPEKTKNMDMTPAQLVAAAKKRNLQWLTFSYTEPTVYYEFALEAAKLAKKNKLKVAVSSAGFMTGAPLKELMKYVDAFSITLKGSTPDFYKEVCKANLEDVRKSIQLIAKSKKWMEVVYLVVPGMNDDDQSFRTAAKFVAGLSPMKTIPLHFLRFSPMYLLRNLQPTPLKTLDRAYDIAVKERLKYVYVDVTGHKASATYCLKCKRPVIERAGFNTVRNDVVKGRCKKCKTRVHGIFS